MDKPASRNGDATAAWFDWSIKNAASTKYDTFLAAYALGRAAVSERGSIRVPVKTIDELIKACEDYNLLGFATDLRRLKQSNERN